MNTTKKVYCLLVVVGSLSFRQKTGSVRNEKVNLPKNTLYLHNIMLSIAGGVFKYERHRNLYQRFR